MTAATPCVLLLQVSSNYTTTPLRGRYWEGTSVGRGDGGGQIVRDWGRVVPVARWNRKKLYF